MDAFKTAVALTIVILGAGCATHEKKQAAEPPLIQAERRRARAENLKLNTALGAMFANSLAADPEIRRHYQFWGFS